MITLFTSPACPKCKILKSKLEEKGIKFEESQDYGRMHGLMSLPALELEDGTIETYEYTMLWLSMMGKEKIFP